MNDVPTDERWSWENISGHLITAKAAWLMEPRDLDGRRLRFFETAGKILVYARFDYLLISPVFFHAIIGLESALKMHYNEDESRLKPLLGQAVGDGLVNDSIFSEIPPLSSYLAKQGKDFATHSALLAELVPLWRNQYFHGDSLLASDYFHFTLRMRDIADVLTTKKFRPTV